MRLLARIAAREPVAATRVGETWLIAQAGWGGWGGCAVIEFHQRILSIAGGVLDSTWVYRVANARAAGTVVATVEVLQTATHRIDFSSVVAITQGSVLARGMLAGGRSSNSNQGKAKLHGKGLNEYPGGPENH